MNAIAEGHGLNVLGHKIALNMFIASYETF